MAFHIAWMQPDKVYYLLNSTVLCFLTTPKPKGTTASQVVKVLSHSLKLTYPHN